MTKINIDVPDELWKRLSYKALELNKMKRECVIMAIEDFVGDTNGKKRENETKYEHIAN